MRSVISKKTFLVSLTVFVFVFTSIFASATSTKKMLEAYYGVKIEYNGQILSSTSQPFIVNGTTYVPVRMIMNSFADKYIQWDETNQKVIIFDSSSIMEAVYQQQLLERNHQIKLLIAELEELRKQNIKLNTKIDSEAELLDELEYKVDDKYEEYDDKIISISLRGNEDEITLIVKIDEDEWDDFSQNDKESFLDKVCEDIWDVFQDADINGYVKDGSDWLDEFDIYAGRDVKLKSIDDKLDDLEDIIEDERIEDWESEGLNLVLSVYGDEDDIEFEIRLNLSTFDDEWDLLSDIELKRLMDGIYDDIDDEYSNATIKGYIYDMSTQKSVAEYDGSDLTRD